MARIEVTAADMDWSSALDQAMRNQQNVRIHLVGGDTYVLPDSAKVRISGDHLNIWDPTTTISTLIRYEQISRVETQFTS
jgi:hypothetical protein